MKNIFLSVKSKRKTKQGNSKLQSLSDMQKIVIFNRKKREISIIEAITPDTVEIFLKTFGRAINIS